MTIGSVLYQQHDGIVTLTMNRPETLNAMNEAMMGEIERILIELEADTAVRVVVLTGAGRAFSSGGDQKRGGAEVPPIILQRRSRGRAHRAPESLRSSHAAAPQTDHRQHQRRGRGSRHEHRAGHRSAHRRPRRRVFGEVFARVGLVPDGGGTYFLPRLVGTAKAMEMILLADIIDAQEALRIGLVNRVVPAEQLEQETLKLGERLAQGPTVAYGLAKTGLYQGLGMSLEDVPEHGGAQPGDRRPHPDRAEGVAAFREKRPPRFTGVRGPILLDEHDDAAGGRRTGGHRIS